MFCKKGANVLIVGTGAGGCVKGALKAGFNVIGVENDEKQYNQLKSDMNAWVARIKKEKEAPKSRKPKRRSPLLQVLPPSPVVRMMQRHPLLLLLSPQLCKRVYASLAMKQQKKETLLRRVVSVEERTT